MSYTDTIKENNLFKMRAKHFDKLYDTACRWGENEWNSKWYCLIDAETGDEEINMNFKNAYWLLGNNDQNVNRALKFLKSFGCKYQVIFGINEDKYFIITDYSTW